MPGLIGVMRTCLAVIATVALGTPSAAVVRPGEPALVTEGRAPRTQRAITHATIASFTAIVDDDTGVPLRMWRAEPKVAGSVSDAAIAEAAARAFLASHIAVLAPGAAVTDFELASNVRSPEGALRSIGFVQRAHGLRVVGGAIGFAFKNDRIALVSSTALPNIRVAVPTTRLASTTVATRAVRWLGQTGVRARARAPRERVIMPIVHARSGAAPDIEYHVAEQLALDAQDELGTWDVWIDAADGHPIARATRLHYTTGKVLLDAPDRHPGGTRTARPAAFATHTVDGLATTSLLDGTITWPAGAPASVALALEGPYVNVKNAAGERLAETVSLAPNGTFTWSRASDELADAQITAFVHTNIAKQFARTHVNPNLAWLDGKVNVNVNINQTCNAASNGNDTFFFRKRTNECENTGRMADVVYHELGHSIHYNSVIAGVGMFESALSEGISDVFASLITRDAGMGRGFFLTNEPLRDLDNAKRWPNDVGEAHDTGEIIGGALWHLGQALDATLGPAASFEKQLDIYNVIISRASDIPSSFAEALLADDDDGDLTNGTPNQCAITTAFGRHGLADPEVTLGLTTPTRDGLHVAFAVEPASNVRCPGPTIHDVTLVWRQRGRTTARIPMLAGGASYAADLPPHPERTVLQYQVMVTLSDGSFVTYPRNAADPFYELYIGPVEPVTCFDFEDGAQGWTHTATSGDEWEVGPPTGLGGDPVAAHGGSSVLGTDLRADGTYAPQTKLTAESPEIDARGHRALRLQLYRWLGVEDGYFDKARILVNDHEVWKNYAGKSSSSNVTHRDHEWRFTDVDVSELAAASGGKLRIKLELESDARLELGGWTVDDVCIVAFVGEPACGDGTLDDGETCDDGNLLDDDGCDAVCALEPEIDAGCCSTTGGEGAIALSVLVFGLVIRRRSVLGRLRRRGRLRIG